jgi:hypothetical protein
MGKNQLFQWQRKIYVYSGVHTVKEGEFKLKKSDALVGRV